MKQLISLLLLIIIWEGDIDCDRYRISQSDNGRRTIIERKVMYYDAVSDDISYRWTVIDEQSADCSIIWKAAALYWRLKATSHE